MIKAILFDVDGIVLTARTQFFSHRFAAEQGIPKEAVEEFFLGNFKKCSFGQADLKEEVAPFLPKWGWQGTVEEFLTHWFESESTKDEAVLALVEVLREKGVKCYIATRQEKYRFRYLLDVVGLKERFDGAFCTCEIGCDKKDPKFYEYILKVLGLAAGEVLFFDDSQSNVDAALSLGIDAYLYQSAEQIQQVLAESSH